MKSNTVNYVPGEPCFFGISPDVIVDMTACQPENKRLIVYFITAFSALPTDKKFSCGDSRCFGFYADWETANEVLTYNTCDIHEHLYMYAFIERIAEGIHPICTKENRWYYEYDRETGLWIRKEEPECLAHICNFSIG